MSRRGAALLTALCLSVFLFALGLGFLYSLDRDSGMQLRSQRMTQATYLARAALDLYTSKEYTSVPTGTGFPLGMTPEMPIGDPAYHGFIQIEKLNANCDCRCYGRVKDSAGNVLAQRVLFCPGESVSATPLVTITGPRRDLTFDMDLDQ